MRGLAWSGSALTAQVVLNIVSVSILARILTPHDYGVIAGAFVVVAFGTMLSGLGLGPTLIQRREIGPEHVATATTLSLAISVLLGGARDGAEKIQYRRGGGAAYRGLSRVGRRSAAINVSSYALSLTA
ncbi:MAG: oligosaccharide flippase family protein [Hyphomicrobiales bacterium]|nr:oligosaccharide flippase family protein [Hyphomicrobiales bacterium]